MAEQYNQNLNAEITRHVQTLQGWGVLSANEGARLIQIGQGRSMRVRQRYNANLRRAVAGNLAIRNVPASVFQTSDRVANGQRIMSEFSRVMERNDRMQAIANRFGNAGFIFSNDLYRRFGRAMEYRNTVRADFIDMLERVSLDVLRAITPLFRGQRIVTMERLRRAMNATVWRQLEYFSITPWALNRTSERDPRTNFERITGHPPPQFNLNMADDGFDFDDWEQAENDYYQAWLDLHEQGILQRDYNLQGGQQLVEYDERHAPVAGRFIEGDNDVPFLRAIRDHLIAETEEFFQFQYNLLIVYDTERYIEQVARGQQTEAGYVLRRTDENLRMYVTLFGATYEQALIDNGCVPTAMAKCFCPTKSDNPAVQEKKLKRDFDTVIEAYKSLFNKEFTDGITIGELKAFLGTGENQQDLSTYLFDQYGNLVLSYTSANGKKNTGRYRKALVGWVFNNHLYVVEDKKMRDIMCKSAEAHSNPKFSLGQEIKKELPVRIVNTADELRKIVKERTKEGGVVPRIFGKGLRNWRVAMFDDEVVKVLTNKEEKLSREMAQVLDVPFEGQKFVSLIGVLMEKHGVDLKNFESAFNGETLQIYNNENKSLASSYGLCKLWKPNGIFMAVDQIKAYTQTVLHHIDELPVFDMTERIIAFDGAPFSAKTLYYIECKSKQFNENAWSIRGNGWYYGALLEQTWEHEDFEVICQVTPNRWVSALPFKQIFQWCIDNMSETCAKNVCNSIVGLFGQTTKFKSIEVHMSETMDDVLAGQIHDKFNDLILYGTKPEPTVSQSHCVPINHFIVQMAQLRLWKLALKLKAEGYKICGVKTDCIIYEGSLPTEDTDDYKSCEVPIFHCENKTPWRTQRFNFVPVAQQVYFKDDAERFNALIRTDQGCLVSGGGGNGKSHCLVNSRLITRHYPDTLIMAPSWVATLNIVNKSRSDLNYMTAQMALLYRNLDWIGQRYRYIVVDEVSMVSPKMLQSLLYLKRKHNVVIYLFGDLSQLLAIGVGSWRWDMVLAELCPYHMELTVFRRGDPEVKCIADQLRSDAKATFSQICKIMCDYTGKFGMETTRSAIAVTHKDKNNWNRDVAKKYEQEYPDGIWIEGAKTTVVEELKPVQIDEKYTINGTSTLTVLPDGETVEPAGIVEKDEFWSVDFYIFEGVELIAYNTVSTKDCKFYNSQILTVKNINKEAKTFTATIKDGIEFTVPFKVAQSSLQYAPKFGCVTIYKSQGLTFDYQYCIIGSKFMTEWLAKKYFDTFRRYVYVAFTRATDIKYISFL